MSTEQDIPKPSNWVKQDTADAEWTPNEQLKADIEDIQKSIVTVERCRPYSTFFMDVMARVPLNGHLLLVSPFVYPIVEPINAKCTILHVNTNGDIKYPSEDIEFDAMVFDCPLSLALNLLDKNPSRCDVWAHETIAQDMAQALNRRVQPSLTGLFKYLPFENISNQVCLSVDDKPLYTSFITTVIKMWRRYGYEVYLGYTGGPNETIDVVEKLKNVTVIRQPRPKDSVAQSMAYAKLLRFYMAAEVVKEDSFSTLSDIDYFLLDRHQHDKHAQKRDLNTLYTIGYNHFDAELEQTQKCQRFQVMGTTGSTRVFKDLLKTKGRSYDEWISTLTYNMGTVRKIFGSESVDSEFFSDEQLFQQFQEDLIDTKVRRLPRGERIFRGVMCRRLDRALRCTKGVICYSGLRNSDHSILDGLKRGWWIDVMPTRPMNRRDMAPLLHYLHL